MTMQAITRANGNQTVGLFHARKGGNHSAKNLPAGAPERGCPYPRDPPSQKTAHRDNSGDSGITGSARGIG